MMKCPRFADSGLGDYAAGRVGVRAKLIQGQVNKARIGIAAANCLYVPSTMRNGQLTRLEGSKPVRFSLCMLMGWVITDEIGTFDQTCVSS